MSRPYLEPFPGPHPFLLPHRPFPPSSGWPISLSAHRLFLSFLFWLSFIGSSLWQAGISRGVQALEHMGSLVALHGFNRPVARGGLSSPNRDQTRDPCGGRQIVNHWTTRELPAHRIFTRAAPSSWNPLAPSFLQLEAFMNLHCTGPVQRGQELEPEKTRGLSLEGPRVPAQLLRRLGPSQGRLRPV